MHSGAVLSMTGDADVAAQSLLARQEERGDCAVGGEGLLPFISFDQIVQLDQVYRVDTHPFEASFQFGAGSGTFALAGLGGQKYFLAFAGEPRGEPLLGGAVAGGGVDVVNASTGDDRECGVGVFLAHVPQCGSPEDQPATAMASIAE
jgi:hypothetical protein